MMFKIELWDKTYEITTKDYVFRTQIKPLSKEEQSGVGKTHVFQLEVGLYYSVVDQIWIKSPEVDTTQLFDDLLAYVKYRIESAVKINEPPCWGWGYAGDLKLNRLNPTLPPVKANQKWIKTPERLLQVDKIDHIRKGSKKEGGGTIFFMNYCEDLLEADLPFEEACRLLGYVE